MCSDSVSTSSAPCQQKHITPNHTVTKYSYSPYHAKNAAHFAPAALHKYWHCDGPYGSVTCL